MYHPRFKDNHYVMGQKMGSIFIKCNAQFPIKLDPFQTEFGRESGKLLKQFFPEATEEIKGVTDVMGINNELFTSSFINGEEGINQYGGFNKMKKILNLPHRVCKSTCFSNGLEDILEWKGRKYLNYLLPVLGGIGEFT